MSRALLPLFLALALTGCDSLFGSKDDATTDEVFDEGAVDPTLVDEVGYVPLSPFYSQGANGGALQRPVDVYVGYDELIYVADQQGLHILDLAGRPQSFIGEITGVFNNNGTPDDPSDDVEVPAQPLRDITAVIQDRSLDILIAARRDTALAGVTWDLPVVYRLSGATTGIPTVEDIVWHPFDDRSRTDNQFRPPQCYLVPTSACTQEEIDDPMSSVLTDEDARFTDIAVLADNSFYVTRSGPVNTQAEGLNNRVEPFNVVLAFSPDGVNTRAVGLSQTQATQPSLLSSVYPSAVATPIGPPQRSSFTEAEDFFVAQNPPGLDVRYPVLSILVVETTQGTEFRVDTERLGASANPENGDGFLYEDFGLRGPTSMTIAADETGYLFVTDEETDSLYVFNRNGIEGVAPPPASGSLRPVRVSFGGTGSGPLSFDDPQGVAYFERIVYVADAGNNRIARYRLNTDFE
ncbi:MAG: hypothetical protein AAGI91_14835 [Bacteroidota bacterium]